MLLYAGGHRSFVIDAYTKRIFQRHGWPGKSGKRPAFTAFRRGRAEVSSEGGKAESEKNSKASYDELKELCESALSQKTGAARLDYWQDYHAQLVMVGKRFCRTRAPRCDECPIKPLLPRKN
jgi:endonuclease-3 related protein